MKKSKQQTLYLLRHAKAEPWAPGINDLGRAINARGFRHMQRLAEWVKDALAPPETVLCSTSTRTRETLAPLLEAWPGIRKKTHYVPKIYEATTGTLHSLATEAFSSIDSVMMVGHNPGFEQLLTGILGEEDAAGILKFPTGTLAVVDFERGWMKDAGRGVLRHWVNLKDLAGL